MITAVRRVAFGLLLGVTLLVLPDSTDAPTSVSLVELESAKAVDFNDGVVWILALGSDARPGQDMLEGNADAIQLVGINFETGSAVALGIPRDSWLEIGGDGFNRINAGLDLGGPSLMASEVQELTGIAPQYVVTTGLAGFTDLVDAIDGVVVRSDKKFQDPVHGLDIRPGPNPLDGRLATGYARSRYPLAGGDFERSAHHQALLRAILARIQEREDEEGFIEAGALAALRGLDTNLDPRELYRFAQALTQVSLNRVQTCVLDGTPDTSSGGASIIHVDEAQARRLGRDARDDATLTNGCG